MSALLATPTIQARPFTTNEAVARRVYTTVVNVVTGTHIVPNDGWLHFDYIYRGSRVRLNAQVACMGGGHGAVVVTINGFGRPMDEVIGLVGMKFSRGLQVVPHMVRGELVISIPRNTPLRPIILEPQDDEVRELPMPAADAVLRKLFTELRERYSEGTLLWEVGDRVSFHDEAYGIVRIDVIIDRIHTVMPGNTGRKAVPVTVRVIVPGVPDADEKIVDLGAFAQEFDLAFVGTEERDSQGRHHYLMPVS